MANKKIGQFSNKSVPSSGDKFLIEDAAGNYFYVTESQLAALLGGSSTLASVLTGGNKTGEQSITSDDTDSTLDILDGEITIQKTGSGGTSRIQQTDLKTEVKYNGTIGNGLGIINDFFHKIQHSIKNIFVAPINQFDAENNNFNGNVTVNADPDDETLSIKSNLDSGYKIIFGISDTNNSYANFNDASANTTISILGENGQIIADSFKVDGGTSSQFLKGDGSVDSNSYATTAYADGLVSGLLDDRGSYDASSNLFPSSGGSGTAGAILKGDIWYISVAGTLGGQSVTVGDSVRAIADSPGQTATNWSILETNIGYVPENVANKTDSYTLSSSTTYSSTKALVDGLATKIDVSKLVTESFTYTGSPFTLANNVQYVFMARLTNGIILDETNASELTISGTTATVTHPVFESGDKFIIKYLAA